MDEMDEIENGFPDPGQYELPGGYCCLCPLPF